MGYESKQNKSKDQKVRDQEVTQMKGITHRPISDMESNGVYFDKSKEEDLKSSIEEEREISLCYYSGLPSLKSYTEGIKEVEER